MKEQDQALIERLEKSINRVKSAFVGKDEIIDLMAICLVGRENLFLLGPPGTAKSAMVKELAKVIKGKYFEYLLTRFTEPNEIYGPFDIRKLREGDLVTNTHGMLPEANLIFLDELFNANSAILNSLLMALNEKVFKRGRESKKIPALMYVGASNQLPEDEALQALYDRFLIRVRCDYVDTESLNGVLLAGWDLEKNLSEDIEGISAEDLFEIQKMVHQVELDNIRPDLIDMITKLRNAGIPVSDRRAVKLQRLIAASALICKRMTAIRSDLWILKYIWDRDDQVEIVANIVNATIEKEETNEGDIHHPNASKNTLPNADELYKEVASLQAEWNQPEVSMSERTIIKDKLRHINGRTEWLTNNEQREYVLNAVNELWEKILKKDTVSE